MRLVWVSWQPFGTGAPKKHMAFLQIISKHYFLDFICYVLFHQFIQEESLWPGRKAMMCPGFIGYTSARKPSLGSEKQRRKLIPTKRKGDDSRWLFAVCSSVLSKFPIHKETTHVGCLRWCALRQVIELSTSGDGLEVLARNKETKYRHIGVNHIFLTTTRYISLNLFMYCTTYIHCTYFLQ